MMIDIDGGPHQFDQRALWPSRSDDTVGRALFHESVHYCQYLSQAFLLRLATEEWDRLRAYEERSALQPSGAVRREFDRVDAEAGFSPRDLHECLARFWDVLAVSPSTIVAAEWDSGRAAALPDVRELYRRQRLESGLSEGTWGQVDVDFAMRMAAGQYAAPFTAVSESGLPHATFVFPWLSHFAMATRSPARMFIRFLNGAAERLVHVAQDLLSSADVPDELRFEYAMSRLGLVAEIECIALANDNDDPLIPPMRAFVESKLSTHPVYAASFRGAMSRAASALASTGLLQRRVQMLAGDRATSDYSRFVAFEIVIEYLATPSLETSRRFLQAAGLVPPCVRQAHAPPISMRRIYREAALSAGDHLSQFDMFRQLVAIASKPGMQLEEQHIMESCLDVQGRWENFTADLRRSATPRSP